MIRRRRFLAGAGASLLLTGAGAVFARDGRQPVVMWRDPGCGCCLAWAQRVESVLGRPVQVVSVSDLAALKRARGIPADLQSCHTASVDDFLIEGHVPPADIARLISLGDRKVRGLAVPGMPVGSPGMDVGHNQRERFQVIAFGRGGGRTVFATHG